MDADARATVEFAIGHGITKHGADLGINASDMSILIEDIRKSLFSEDFVWALYVCLGIPKDLARRLAIVRKIL